MSYSMINSRGQTYYLHGKDVVLKNGREQRIYFFAKQPKDEGVLDTIPEGMEITENKQTGLPVLRRIKQPA